MAESFTKTNDNGLVSYKVKTYTYTFSSGGIKQITKANLGIQDIPGYKIIGFFDATTNRHHLSSYVGYKDTKDAILYIDTSDGASYIMGVETESGGQVTVRLGLLWANVESIKVS